jgi:hypothetical protein
MLRRYLRQTSCFRIGRTTLLGLMAIILFQNTAYSFVQPDNVGRSVRNNKLKRPTNLFKAVRSNQDGTKLQPSDLQGLTSCSSATNAKRLLQQVLSDTPNAKYNSIRIPPGASQQRLSDGELAIYTRLVNKKYSIMEVIQLSGDRDAARASLAALVLTVGSFCSAVIVNQTMPGPEILRFLLVWLLSFAPLIYAGYGMADVDKLQTLLVTVQQTNFPVYRKRMIQHEAGHFLMGHLLGWPIRGYSANAVKNAVEFHPLSDPDVGKERASQLGFDRRGSFVEDVPLIPILEDRPFLTKAGRQDSVLGRQSDSQDKRDYNKNAILQLPFQQEPSNAWPYRGFDEMTLDQLTVISMGGVCAEILAYGNAEGGVADFSQLRQIFNSAEAEMSERDIDNRIRFGISYTLSQLRMNLGALDALANAMERDGSVDECVFAIESCENPSGYDGIEGDYELRRREKFRAEGNSLIRKLLLSDKNIDADENGYVEGRGGGYKKQEVRLTGDDPLYAALAVALAFAAWANSGGLTLH